jgi:hypothetical protein
MYRLPFFRVSSFSITFAETFIEGMARQDSNNEIMVTVNPPFSVVSLIFLENRCIALFIDYLPGNEKPISQ